MIMSLTQTKFLSNVCNKHKFVVLLGKYLQEKGIKVIHAEEDADVLIVNTAINLNQEIDKTVAVVGNDTDLLVLLVALTPDTDNIYFYKMAASKRSNNTLYSTVENKRFKEYILFAHAFAGCDTTSAIFGKGKKAIIKLLEKNEDLRTTAKEFCNFDVSTKNLEEAAKKIILKLYGINDDDMDMGNIRYRRFVALSAQSHAEIRLSSLPPTTSALILHAKRVYYQMQLWLGNNLQPQEWGWKRLNAMMVPIMTTDDAAPKELLNQVKIKFQ